MTDVEKKSHEVLEKLRGAGFEAWQVGGCVRDRLLNLPLDDIDIATNARPEDIRSLFPKVQLVGASFGVCIAHVNDHTFEMATFRKDGAYIDHRRPESVTYGTMEDDARRRDFTINALYYNPLTDELRDPTGGREDLRKRLIRTVGDPARRFDEDALRLLRAIRFAARFDFEIEQKTWEALCRQAPAICHISPERQRIELTGMFTGPAPDRALRLLDESGLLEIVLPEVHALHGVEQGKRFHPEGDVFEHTVLCMKNLKERTPVTAWAMLLHDIGKPPTFERRGGRITFYEHDRVGAEMARQICHRFRFSNEKPRRIADVVGRHMRFVNARHWKKSTLRRFMAADTIDEDLAVHRADCLSSHGMLDAWEKVKDELEGSRAEERGPALPEPLIDGNDLKDLGLKPGPIFREILEDVQEKQLDGELRTPEEAISYVKETHGKEDNSDL